MTAAVVFSNLSPATGPTLGVLLDGVQVAVLPPGEQTGTRTVAAGQHTLAFRIINTAVDGCTPTTPVWAQCSENFHGCGVF